MDNVLLVFSSCPDRECADNIAANLIDGQLAACVNILSPITSVYSWQGKRETAEEVLLLIKTTSSRYQALQQTLVSLHPYELPEIIAVPVTQGLPSYLDWVNRCTKTDSSN